MLGGEIIMKLITKIIIIVLVILSYGKVVIAEGIIDYSNFSSLPDEQKGKIIWDLFDKQEFGKTEHKPICHVLLLTQGKFTYANATAFTSAAINLTEQQGWKDFDNLILNIYQYPSDIWLYKRAFLYLKKQSRETVPNNFAKASEILYQSGTYSNIVSDQELENAKQILFNYPDKEMVLVYVLETACRHAGKGGTDRGRIEAIDILKALNQNMVCTRLKSFNFHPINKNLYKQELDWVADKLGLSIA